MISPQFIEKIIISKIEKIFEAKKINIVVVNKERSNLACVLVVANRENAERFDNLNLGYSINVNISYKSALNTNNNDIYEEIESIIQKEILLNDCWLYPLVNGLVSTTVTDNETIYNEENQKRYLNKNFNLRIIGR